MYSGQRDYVVRMDLVTEVREDHVKPSSCSKISRKGVVVVKIRECVVVEDNSSLSPSGRNVKF